jgi:hypothetical protein
MAQPGSGNAGAERSSNIWRGNRDLRANDVRAFGVVRTTLDCGLRIPEDLSLIGFDNIEFSTIVHPPLTTIHQPDMR